MEGEDACFLKVGEKVTLINWGNVLIQAVNRYVSEHLPNNI